MLKAIIFDFNGIIVNDEPIHFELFAKVMNEEEISISKEEYYRFYLHLNDKDAFQTALQKKHKRFTQEKIKELIDRKAKYYREIIRTKVSLFPDAADFIRHTAQEYVLAIASGALYSEIEFVLKQSQLLHFFPVIIGAEQTSSGKPHPECYLTALKELNAYHKINPPISSSECLVIEDSVGGILGAHRAGMVCLAVTNSYSKIELEEAEFIVNSLPEIDFNQINTYFEK